MSAALKALKIAPVSRSVKTVNRPPLVAMRSMATSEASAPAKAASGTPRPATPASSASTPPRLAPPETPRT